MTLSSRLPFQPFLRHTAVAIAMAAAYGSAWAALPDFTLDPSALGATEQAVTADNILITNYSQVTFSGTTFTDSGYLVFTNYQLDGGIPFAGGLNTDYGVYIRFDGVGDITSANTDPSAGDTKGQFTELTFSMYGYTDMTSTFGLDGSGTPVSTAPADMLLGTGTLLSGIVSTDFEGGISFSPDATATMSFATNNASFFTSPVPFYNIAFATFKNTFSQIEFASASGFSIQGGGGAINFVAAPIPEPETYALLLAGLAAVGFVARRRRSA